MKKARKTVEIIKKLPADERRAVKAALARIVGRRTIPEARAIECVTSVAAARARTEARRKSDRETDRGRRLTIGARVPREQAERYKAAAADEGISLYAWVVTALDDALADSGQ